MIRYHTGHAVFKGMIKRINGSYPVVTGYDGIYTVRSRLINKALAYPVSVLNSVRYDGIDIGIAYCKTFP